VLGKIIVVESQDVSLQRIAPTGITCSGRSTQYPAFALYGLDRSGNVGKDGVMEPFAGKETRDALRQQLSGGPDQYSVASRARVIADPPIGERGSLCRAFLQHQVGAAGQRRLPKHSPRLIDNSTVERVFIKRRLQQRVQMMEQCIAGGGLAEAGIGILPILSHPLLHH
jgi:hypothetical protein